jgi:aminoglycoside phosphotransferase (APT) family kinase protein
VESLTKRRVDATELAALVRRAFGPRTRVDRWHELVDGHYNAAYEVRLTDGSDLVLKVAPPPELALLTHEVDLMRTEVDVYRRAGTAGVAVPEVVHADFTRDLIGTDFVFLTRIDGVALNTIRDELTPAALAAVRAEIAAQAVRLHAITGPGYGYPLRGSRTWQSSWRGAFGAMVEDILADAARLGTSLPAPPDRIGALLRRHADALDPVDRPALVHFDLWDGNVLVRPDRTGGVRVAGLIDGERALFGDPVAEFVAMTLFRDLADEPAILAGYAGASPTPVTLTTGVRRRLALYTSYLCLIMAVEGVTRGWTGPAQDERDRRVAALLDEQLTRLR